MGTVEELELKFNTLQQEVKDLKQRLTEARIEMKGTAAITTEQFEAIQHQINLRFDGVHTRLDENTQMLSDILSLMRGGIQEGLAGPQEEGEEDPQ